MSKIREHARGLLAAKELLRTEAAKEKARVAARNRQSRKALHRRRQAEIAAADALANGAIPESIDVTRRQLAKAMLESSGLAGLLSKPETADLELRLSHRLKTGHAGPKTRAAYWSALGDPPECEPGDVNAARLFHRRILQVLDQGGWTRKERSALYMMAARWRKRMDGLDARFMEVGTVGPGRLPRHVEKRIKAR